MTIENEDQTVSLDAYVMMQTHRDAWRQYYYGTIKEKPTDFLDATFKAPPENVNNWDFEMRCHDLVEAIRRSIGHLETDSGKKLPDINQAIDVLKMVLADRFLLKKE
jgi:hypothetical protein